MLSKLKWGFLFNSSKEVIKLLEKMYEKGKVADEMRYSIGQGLNLTKDYIISNNEKIFVTEEALIPFYTVENNGTLIWEKAEKYIINKSKNRKHDKDFKEFDTEKTKKVPPAIILPRGIGNRHYASINKLEGYSSSYVDIYIPKEKQEDILKVWIFCNSSAFWLIREIAGRTNLGGGMLKAEAVDIRNIPILYQFKDIDQLK